VIAPVCPPGACERVEHARPHGQTGTGRCVSAEGCRSGRASRGTRTSRTLVPRNTCRTCYARQEPARRGAPGARQTGRRSSSPLSPVPRRKSTWSGGSFVTAFPTAQVRACQVGSSTCRRSAQMEALRLIDGSRARAPATVGTGTRLVQRARSGDVTQDGYLGERPRRRHGVRSPTTGTVNMNRVPLSAPLSAQMRPPCAVTMPREMYRPSPRPLVRVSWIR